MAVILKEDFVKLRTLKLPNKTDEAWIEHFATLYGKSEASEARLQLTPQDASIYSNIKPYSIYIEELSDVKKESLKGNPNSLSFRCEGRLFQLAMFKGEQVDQWRNHLLALKAEYDYKSFEVNVSPTEISRVCKLEEDVTYSLKVFKDCMNLVHPITKETVFVWKYGHIRRYGHSSTQFRFEAGRKCESGPGMFAFVCDKPIYLFDYVMAKTKQLRTTELANGGDSKPPEKTESSDNIPPSEKPKVQPRPKPPVATKPKPKEESVEKEIPCPQRPLPDTPQASESPARNSYTNRPLPKKPTESEGLEWKETGYSSIKAAGNNKCEGRKPPALDEVDGRSPEEHEYALYDTSFRPRADSSEPILQSCYAQVKEKVSKTISADMVESSTSANTENDQKNGNIPMSSIVSDINKENFEESHYDSMAFCSSNPKESDVHTDVKEEEPYDSFDSVPPPPLPPQPASNPKKEKTEKQGKGFFDRLKQLKHKSEKNEEEVRVEHVYGELEVTNKSYTDENLYEDPTDGSAGYGHPMSH